MSTDLLSLQLDLEDKYSRQLFNKKIREFVSGAGMDSKAQPLVQALGKWIYKDHGYESKNERMLHLYGASLNLIIEELLIIILPMSEPVTIQYVASKLASKNIWNIRPDTKLDAVKTCCEMICELAMYNTYYEVLLHNGENGVLVKSRVGLTPEMAEDLENSSYVPPMVIPPRIRKKTSDSAYLKIERGALPKALNQHKYPLNLNALNIAGMTGFKIYPQTFDLAHPIKESDQVQKMSEVERQRRDREHHRKAAYAAKLAHFYHTNDLTFYFAWFYDARGRMYPEGYHLTANGDDYEKACIVLADQEPVTGL